MKIKFPYKKERSKLFGSVNRPVALASFWSNKYDQYLEFTFIIDTGADYTIFPISKSLDLGIDLQKDCVPFKTSGIGGSETAYLLPKIKMKLGTKEIFIPVGFLKRDNIPPLLGRYKCLDVFSVLFHNCTTTFSV